MSSLQAETSTPSRLTSIDVFRGVAIAMVTAGLMALAFMGFAGLDKYQ